MAKEIKFTTRLLVYKKYGCKCAYCGIDLEYSDLQVDHINPRRRGDLKNPNVVNGVNKIENYNPSCKSCNSSKSTFSIEEWRSQIKHKIVCLRRDVSNFRILERYGLVSVNDVEVVFYFEKESEVDNG